MQALLIVLGSIIFFFIILVVLVIGIYNRIIRLRNQFKNAYSQIDVQLQRRYELIPNLVETAKAFMDHEKETMIGIIEARNQAHKISVNLANDPGNAAMMQQLMAAEGQLSAGLGKLFALAENYPELKADETMKRLMEELTHTENKVSFARQAFNDAVMVFNNSIQEFPNNILAGIFNFSEAKPLEVDKPEMREAVKVSFE